MDRHTLNCQHALSVAAQYRFKLKASTREALEQGTASIDTIHWIVKTKPDMVKRKAAKQAAGVELPKYLTVANYDMPDDMPAELADDMPDELAAELDPEPSAAAEELPETELDLPVPANKRKRWGDTDTPLRRSNRRNKYQF